MGTQPAALYGVVEKPRQLTLPRNRAGTLLPLEAILLGAGKAVVVEAVEVVAGVTGGSPLAAEMHLKAGSQWMLVALVQAKSNNSAHGVSSPEQPQRATQVATATKVNLATETGPPAQIVPLCSLDTTWTLGC